MVHKRTKSYSKRTIYENRVKPVLDRMLSLICLVALSPAFGMISLAVVIDDPGPVFFTQERVGRDRVCFKLHKFRSMKLGTPRDVPTHQLEQPGRYMTRVGRLLRKSSLDELPQLWDIFRGKMSLVGPRPALWNQDDLLEEREKYGANSIMPGLTGWAQIHGRDELEIMDKAKLDGEYVKQLKQGGVEALLFDAGCLLGTIVPVLRGAGIAGDGIAREGMERWKKTCRKPKGNDWKKDSKKMEENGCAGVQPVATKKILITGKGSYIGNSIKAYLERLFPAYYCVDMVDTVGFTPVPAGFYGYDVVIHTAGIVHRRETNENRPLYYAVNRDQAVSIAKAAKKAKVGQFIILSSMSVYGMATGRILKETVPFPDSAYGESKLSADEAIEKLADAEFRVAILRPPMVYGKGCKGNYQALRKFALSSPLVPTFQNERSMIFIGNLCEFVRRTIDTEATGVFFPQNSEYVDTACMVRAIARINGRKMVETKALNPAIKYLPFLIVKKAFGNLTYEKVDTVGKYNFWESMELTEGAGGFAQILEPGKEADVSWR